ncbi:MAG: MFS transporter [Anaerolineae bacterium]|nr:MFS transporter [Anaerolineae bacterium]
MSFSETTLSTGAVSAGAERKIARTAGYYMAFTALGMVAAVLGPTLPGLAEHTQTELREISYLFMARSLGYLLGALAGGRLYDRLRGHPVMAATLVIMAVTMALTPVIPLLWLLFMVLLVMGIGEGTVDVGGNTLLVWTHRDKVGPFMNGLHFFFGAGAFLAPVIIAQAVRLSGDINWAYWILALLIFPISGWLLRLPSPIAQATAEDRPAGPVNRLLVGLIVFFFFLYVGAEVGFGGWIFTYTITLELTGETYAAYLTSAFWGALTLGRLAAIPLAIRLRPRYMLLGDLLGCLASIGIILLWPDSIVAVWLGTLGLGLSMASIFPTTLNLAERRMPISGQVMSLFFVGASIGAMFLPWLIGQLFDAIGPQAVMGVIMADVWVAVGIFFMLIVHSVRTAAPDEVSL